jgi:hypothetical protein
MDASRVSACGLLAALFFAVVSPACERHASSEISAPGRGAPTRKAARVEVALATPSAPSATPIASEPSPCPDGMVEVDGEYCPSLEQRCVRWRDKEGTFPRRCEQLAPSGACRTATTHKRFCIDRFEYPNVRGEKPVVMKTWSEAAGVCASLGKRLCTGSEWTLACEGEERRPYPTGLERSTGACNIDKQHLAVNEKALASADPRTRDAEVERLWQGEPSGARASCVSSYGVFDMTGNVDEWVVNESGRPFKSASKGGYWGPVRNRCRPMTTVHDESFAFYQIGFRCCEDAVAPRTP